MDQFIFASRRNRAIHRYFDALRLNRENGGNDQGCLQNGIRRSIGEGGQAGHRECANPSRVERQFKKGESGVDSQVEPIGEC